MPDIKTIPAIPRLVSLARSFKFVKNPVPIMNEAIDVYGDTYKMYMGGLIAGYVTREPAVVQHVLQKNHRNYKKSKLATETVARYVGKGLLTSDGDYWLQQRRLIQPGFHRAKLAALVDIMNKVIDEVVDDMTHLAKAGQPADLEEWMMKLAFNIVASTLFTTSMSEDDMRRLGQHISDLQGFIIREVRQPYLNPWFKLSGTRRYYERMAEDANDLIRKVIRERKQHGQRFDDLLDMLLAARYEDTGEGMNEQQLLEESLILFLAGHETTANALSWILYLLSQNETVYEKLMAEMDAVVTDGSVSFDQLGQLQYTLQVIQEGMRLYPPAWITDRVSIGPDEVNGVQVPSGSMFVVYIYGVHRNEKFWPEPEQFRPERFTKAAQKERPAFAYLPFGGGPRMCIGNNFALMEMQIALVKLLQRFRFELVPGQRIEIQPLVTLRPRYGIKMKLRERT